MTQNKAGFFLAATKWRTHSKLDWRHPVRSYLNARNELKGCQHIRVKVVRSNRATKSGAFVFQVEGYELPNGDFK